MSENELVPETAIDYEEVFRRGGRNHEDEDFALFKYSITRTAHGERVALRSQR